MALFAYAEDAQGAWDHIDTWYKKRNIKLFR